MMHQTHGFENNEDQQAVQWIERIRKNDYSYQTDKLTLRLAEAFGFCYGVDRAIHKALEACYQYRNQATPPRIWLTNEIIHNPQVNQRLVQMGVQMPNKCDEAWIAQLCPEDVVILPAFGLETSLMQRLQETKCHLVDTTCGSVMRVWRRVECYATNGFTAIIHGKWNHEETIATSSRVDSKNGRYLIVKNIQETESLCRFMINGAKKEDSLLLEQQFVNAHSPKFDFSHDLEYIGLANQTTMLSSESIQIAQMLSDAICKRYGKDALHTRFRSFETICHATQERQDAVKKMMLHPPDLMLVVGGFNSSNTGHLCKIAAESTPTYHVDGVEGILSQATILCLPPGGDHPKITHDWLPQKRPLTIGLTAGASTPNSVVGKVIARLIEIVD